MDSAFAEIQACSADVNLRWGPGMRVGYLSAAPRVSTRDDAEASGPRTHVLGVIGALEELGARVTPFIVGDRMPRQVRTRSEAVLRGGPVQALAADLARISLGAVNARRAWHELRGRVDWVYERAASLQSLGWIFQRHGIPWILETSSPAFYEAKHERASLVMARLARRRELWAYRRCDAVVCVSRDLRDLLAEAGVDEAKLIVLPNGVDTAVFDPARYRDAPRSFPGFTIGFAGTLTGWQALDQLIGAVATLRRRGQDVSVAIAGDGAERTAWERLARELEVADAVRFVGRLPGSAIPGFLAGVDVAYAGHARLQLGRMYHSPLKLYEYMAMGKPVVASAFDDAKSLIDDGETGFLFRAGDRTDLERALGAAYEARGRLPELAARVRSEIIAHHSWRARLEALHRELAQR